MLGQCRKRMTNNKPTGDQHLVAAGMLESELMLLTSTDGCRCIEKYKTLLFTAKQSHVQCEQLFREFL